MRPTHGMSLRYSKETRPISEKAKPPAKRWRVLWGKANGGPLRCDPSKRPNPPRPYDTLPPLQWGLYVCAGPICQTAEQAEQKATEHAATRPQGWRRHVKIVKPVAVSEDGTPLA